jgi:hypothetical protein
MGQKLNPDIFGTEQFPLSTGTPIQGSTIFQSSGTTQTPVDMHLSGADTIQRVALLENKFEQLEGLFGVSTVSVNTLGDENWELKQPVNVAVEQRSSEDFTACLYDVDLYGYGDSIPQALEDLKVVIVNQFEFLLQQKGKVQLGNLLKKQFEFLTNILVSLNV